MKISINYSEAEQYIARHFQKEVMFKLAENSQLNVATPVKVLGFRKNISINLGVVRIEKAHLILTYNGKLGIDLLVSPAIAFLKRLVPEKTNFVRTDSGNIVVVNLQEIDELQSVLEKIDLQAISFMENGFEVDVTLK